MTYRLNGGVGGVTCDGKGCNRLIDAGLSHDEYIETYGKGEDICWRCRQQAKEKKTCGRVGHCMGE
jgi:hypothetical protein